VLQPGNSVELVWRARLEEHLGTIQVERRARSACMACRPWRRCCRLLPERDSHARLHDAFAVILDSLDAPQEAGALYVRFELAVLEDLGFGLDLSHVCRYRRPRPIWSMCRRNRAARFQPAEAGAPWAERMLALPAFLT
jgi:DNA repair protein RecO (recombination protein O)